MIKTEVILQNSLLATWQYKKLDTVWHENFMVVKFYGSPLNRLDEKLLGF